MAMLRWSAAGVLAWSLLGATAPIGLTKPPDLPVDQSVTCPEGRERTNGSYELRIDLANGEIRVEVEATPTTPVADVPATVDAVCPCFLPVLVEHVRRRLAQAQPAPGTPLPAAPVAKEADGRAEQAKRMFQIAERCRRGGDLEMARTCYEETHLMSPTSRFGRLAMQRLRDLERHQDGNGAAEESDAPPTQRSPRQNPTTDEPPLSRGRDLNGLTPAERQFRKMRQRSEPLGLVERTY